MRVNAKLKSEKGFFVGDLCHVMSDEDYNGEWHKDFKEFEGVHELRGHTFALAEVEDGDGVYEDQKGRNYNVDAGTIGVIPIELCEGTIEEWVNHGVVVFAKGATFEGEDGCMNISFDNGEEIYINTQYPEECEDEDEEGGQVFDDEENESSRLMVLKN